MKTQHTTIAIDTKKLSQRRNDRHVDVKYIATFVGVSLDEYWDIESYSDEAYTLTLIKLLRLCVVLHIPPARVLKSRKRHADKPNLSFCPMEEIDSPISSTLRASIGDISANSDKIGWEAEALEQYLSNDAAIGEIPIPALNDICAYLAMDIAQVVTAYWVSLGMSDKTRKSPCGP